MKIYRCTIYPLPDPMITSFAAALRIVKEIEPVISMHETRPQGIQGGCPFSCVTGDVVSIAGSAGRCIDG